MLLQMVQTQSLNNMEDWVCLTVASMDHLCVAGQGVNLNCVYVHKECLCTYASCLELDYLWYLVQDILSISPWMNNFYSFTWLWGRWIAPLHNLWNLAQSYDLHWPTKCDSKWVSCLSRIIKRRVHISFSLLWWLWKLSQAWVLAWLWWTEPPCWPALDIENGQEIYLNCVRDF